MTLNADLQDGFCVIANNQVVHVSSVAQDVPKLSAQCYRRRHEVKFQSLAAGDCWPCPVLEGDTPEYQSLDERLLLSDSGAKIQSTSTTSHFASSVTTTVPGLERGGLRERFVRCPFVLLLLNVFPASNQREALQQ